MGDPEAVADEIFGHTMNHETKEPKINRSVLVEDYIECRRREYIFREEPSAPQDLVIVFGVVDEKRPFGVISQFLYEKLQSMSKISLIIGNEETPVNAEAIRVVLEKIWKKNLV